MRSIRHELTLLRNCEKPGGAYSAELTLVVNRLLLPPMADRHIREDHDETDLDDMIAVNTKEPMRRYCRLLHPR